MLDKLKNTVKSTAIYSIGNIANKLIGIVLLPLYTSYLTTYEFGILAMLEVTNQFFIAVFGLRLSTSMMRWFASEKDEVTRKSIVFTSFIGLLLSILAYNLIFHPFSRSFAIIIFDHERYEYYVTLLLIWSSIEIVNTYSSDLLRIKEKALLYVVLMSIKLTVVLTLNIIFIVKLKLGVIGIVYSQIIGSILMFALTLPVLLKNINYKISIPIMGEMLKYGIPLIFGNISTLILTLGDRYFIKHFLSLNEVGIYSLAFKVVNAIRLVFVNSFQTGFIPIAYKMFDEKDAKAFFSKVFTYFLLIISITALLLSFFSKELLLLISRNNPEYIEAYYVIPLLSVAIILRGTQSFFSLGFHYSKKTKKSAVIMLIAAAINLLLNSILIPSYKLYGACTATIISSIFIAVFLSRQSQKYYTIPFELKRVFMIVSLTVLYFILFYSIININNILNIVIKSTAFCILPIVFIKLKFLHKNELNAIKGAWKKWKNLKNIRSNISQIKHN